MGAADVIPAQAPNGWEEVYAAYGDPMPRVVRGEWRADPDWEAVNMMTVHHRLIPAVQGGKIYLHRKAVPAFLNALDSCERLGYAPKTIGGFNPRAQRGSNGAVLSLHSFGVAFDLDDEENPMIIPPPAFRYDNGLYKLPDAVIAVFKIEGFMWGGTFLHRFDPMHFQLATNC